MIISMLLEIDFCSLGDVRQHWRGAGLLVEAPVMLPVAPDVKANRG